MKNDTLLKKTYKSTVWSFIENISHELISFLLGVVLARLLVPSDYGIIGLTTIFVTLSNVLIDSGFGNALIRKIDRSDNDCSTAFLFNIGIGITAYLIIFASSPFISSFYNEPILSDVLRVVGLNVIFNSLCVVQVALLTASFNIKVQTKINLFVQVCFGVIAIVFAYKGFGVWSLVIQVLGANIAKTILLWYFAKWRPSCTFSIDSFKYLWGYGSKAVCTSLLVTFFNVFFSILIGKFYTKNDLGFYTKSNQLSKVPLNTSTGIIKKVTMPMFAQVQDNTNKLKRYYSSYISILSFVIFPLMFIMASLAEDIVIFMWGEKWTGSVVYLQILCIGAGWAPISTLNTSLLQVLGKTDYMLKLEIEKKIVLFFIIIITLCFGVKILAIGFSAYHCIAALMNMQGSRKYLNYSYKEQLKDILPYAFISSLIIVVNQIICIFDSHILNIVIGTIGGLLVYTIVAYLTKVKAINDMLFYKNKISTNNYL